MERFGVPAGAGGHLVLAETEAVEVRTGLDPCPGTGEAAPGFGVLPLQGGGIGEHAPVRAVQRVVQAVPYAEEHFLGIPGLGGILLQRKGRIALQAADLGEGVGRLFGLLQHGAEDLLRFVKAFEVVPGLGIFQQGPAALVFPPGALEGLPGGVEFPRGSEVLEGSVVVVGQFTADFARGAVILQFLRRGEGFLEGYDGPVERALRGLQPAESVPGVQALLGAAPALKIVRGRGERFRFLYGDEAVARLLRTDVQQGMVGPQAFGQPGAIEPLQQHEAAVRRLLQQSLRLLQLGPWPRRAGAQRSQQYE